jgi:3-oxoadipate enol-lactonase
VKIRANGISMNYEVEGQGENLVLIHGLGDNLNMWYHQVPLFSKSYRVIRYDVRGSGQTDSPPGEYSMSLLVEDAHELMKANGVKSSCFVGYSMGGRIALELSLKYPEMVKALVLANSSGGGIPRSVADQERRKTTVELLDKGNVLASARMVTTGAFSPGYEKTCPDEFERYLSVKAQNKPEGLARLMKSLMAPSSPADLSAVRCPVLIITGDKDLHMTLAQAALVHREIVGSKLVVLPTGHASAIESPQKFNSAVLEFLSRLG